MRNHFADKFRKEGNIYDNIIFLSTIIKWLVIRWSVCSDCYWLHNGISVGNDTKNHRYSDINHGDCIIKTVKGKK